MFGTMKKCNLTLIEIKDIRRQQYEKIVLYYYASCHCD